MRGKNHLLCIPEQNGLKQARKESTLLLGRQNDINIVGQISRHRTRRARKRRRGNRRHKLVQGISGKGKGSDGKKRKEEDSYLKRKRS